MKILILEDDHRSMGVLGTENDELSGPDPDEKLRPVCKKPNVFFRIERPPGNKETVNATRKNTLELFKSVNKPI